MSGITNHFLVKIENNIDVKTTVIGSITKTNAYIKRIHSFSLYLSFYNVLEIRNFFINKDVKIPNNMKKVKIQITLTIGSCLNAKIYLSISKIS